MRILTKKLFILIQRIVEFVVFYFSAVPSMWVILNPLLYIMFLPLGMHFAMTLPWPFLKDVPDPYGRGTLSFLAYQYRPLLSQKSVWNIIETALMLFGVCLFLWSFVIWMKSGGKLVRGGPYKVFRHPQYLGIIVAVLGLSLRTARPIALISWGIMTYAYVLMAFFEEQSLADKFGDEYANYRAKTWFIFPFPKIVIKKFGRTAIVVLATLALITYVMIVVYVSYYCLAYSSLKGVAF